jgi:thiamine pyrophosphate-dependent acetolactate synthase large subunit-like protein
MLMPTFGEHIVKLLEAYGVDHVFGIPGVHTVELYRGFANSCVRHVTPRHEQGAGFMAYGFAIATGRPGVAIVISGPGLANIATAMGEAYADSVPMLILASNNEISHLGLGSGRLHETKSQISIAEQVAGFAHQLLEQRNFPAVLARAFSGFNACRPRPACIEIPLNLLAESSAIELEPWPLAKRPAPVPSAIAEASRLLEAARRPIILLGGGAVDATEAARELAHLLDAPVVTTTSGKGIVSEHDPLSLGASLPFKPVQDYLRDSDAVLAIGTEMSDTDALYTYTRYEVGPNLIRIDIEADQLTRNYKPKVPIVGDAKLAIDALIERLQLGDHRKMGADTAARIRSRLDKQWIPGADAHKRILDAMHDILEDNAILSVEECQLGYTACQYFPCSSPRTMIYPSGYGTLGPAVPAAIGAKLGVPDREVVAISGDGSLLFTLSELVAAVELGVSLPVIVWNNRGYREIAYDMDRKNVRRVGVELTTPDFQSVAIGFGCRAERPDSLAAFRDALSRALEAPVPTMIELDTNFGFLSG